MNVVPLESGSAAIITVMIRYETTSSIQMGALEREMGFKIVPASIGM